MENSVADKGAKQRLIVVLGMHRSGTSAVTRGLQALGASLGDQLMPPAEGVNEKGFFEDLEFNSINIDALKVIESNWFHVAPIGQVDVEKLRLQGYFLRAAELLRKKINRFRIFAFKDPRVAKLLPFWRGVFEHLQLDVCYVLAFRHPLSVVKSLAKRDRFAAEHSYLLWIGHVLESLRGSAGRPRVVVDYDRLIKSPYVELMRIAHACNLEISSAELDIYKNEFLDAELRHTVYGSNDLILDPACPLLVQEVFKTISAIASDQIGLEDPVLQGEIDKWIVEFERIKPPLKWIDQCLSEIASLSQAVTEQAGQIASLDQTVAERDGQIANLNQAIASLDQTVAERDGQIANLNQAVAGLNRVVAERDHHIDALINSRSWQLTRPLRKIVVLTRRFASYSRHLIKRFGQIARVFKDIPAAISRWEARGLWRRAIRVLRENGIRGLLHRGVAFQSLLVHESSYRKFYEERHRQGPLQPAPHRGRVAPKIAYVVNQHDLMTQVYRVHNYADVLTKQGYKCKIFHDNEITPDMDIDADILILNRIPWSESIDRLIQWFRDSGRPTIFDIDDFIIDPSQIHLLRFCQGLPAYDLGLVLSNMQRLEKMMRACDFATVSTFALKVEIEKRGVPAFVLPNNNGLTQMEFAKEKKDVKSENGSQRSTVRIGYFSGTKTHEEDFAECAEALKRVLEENTNAELMIVGQLDLPPALLGMENRIRRRPLMTHPDMLAELSTIDVNLAPLEVGNLFTDCKSELKIFEPALFGIPTVASPTSTYATVIENGRTGYLAATSSEWHAALNALIRDRDLRYRMGRSARDQIAARYAVTTTVEEAKAIYEAALAGSLRRRSYSAAKLPQNTERPLLTIVSVLYRKAREVRYFLEALRRQDFPGRFEIILVDDQTPDDSVAVVRDFQKWAAYAVRADAQRLDIRIQRNETNIGNCGSRNAAIQSARGDVIIVVDADCMFNQSFLSTHFAAHEKGDCDVAIGPINIETHDAPPLSVLGRHEATETFAETENLPQDPVNLDSFVNCITRNFSIRRAFVEEHFDGALFDECFAYSANPNSGFGWEDVEMGYRVYSAGGRIKYLADTVSIHVSHNSSANEAEKPVRSLRNFRRLLEKHPEILTASRQWSIQTYEAIVSWMRSVGTNPDQNPDYQWLELRFQRYRHAPIIIDRSRKLRVLTYRWHVPHQFELYRTGHQFTLLTGTGTALCDTWEFDKRPMPHNVRMIPANQLDARDFDLAIVHFDENVLRPDLCNGKVPDDWGRTLSWFLNNVDLPKVAICHGTPQFAGQYNGNYTGSDLGQILEAERKAIVSLLSDIPVVCNSHQALSEWGFRNSLTIWHGFSPHEYPKGSHARGVLVMLQAALRNRPHYNGLFIYEDVRRLVGNRLNLEHLETPRPLHGYSPTSPEWAVAKYQNYVREVGSHSIYFNPTVRSPMPRARGEAMMAGLVSVSLRNHDVDLFIKNGVNGFFADTPTELAEQLLWLASHPRERERMANASRATAMDIFNQDRYLAEWSRLLNSLVS